MDALGRLRRLHTADRVLLCAAAVLTMGGAACSGTGVVGRPFTVAAPPGTEVPIVTPYVATNTIPTVPAVPAPTGRDALQAFCRDAGQLQTILFSLIFQAGSPQAATNATAYVQRLRSEAPAPLRSTLDTIVQTEQRIASDLDASPQRLSDAGQALADPNYLLALQRVNLYDLTNCGTG